MGMRVGRIICKKGMVPTYFKRDEIIFDRGDVCSRMFVVDSGYLIYDINAMLDNMPTTTGEAEDCYTPQNGRWTSLQPRAAPSTRSSEDDAYVPSAEAGTKRGPGRTLSEAGLWLDWRNKGRLQVGSTTSCVIVMETASLSDCFSSYTQVKALMIVYARKFTEALIAKRHFVSDITGFDIEMCEKPYSTPSSAREGD